MCGLSKIFTSKFFQELDIDVPTITCDWPKWFCCSDCRHYLSCTGYVMNRIYEECYKYCRVVGSEFKFVLTPDNVDLNGVLDFGDYTRGSIELPYSFSLFAQFMTRMYSNLGMYSCWLHNYDAPPQMLLSFRDVIRLRSYSTLHKYRPSFDEFLKFYGFSDVFRFSGVDGLKDFVFVDDAHSNNQKFVYSLHLLHMYYSNVHIYHYGYDRSNSEGVYESPIIGKINDTQISGCPKCTKVNPDHAFVYDSGHVSKYLGTCTVSEDQRIDPYCNFINLGVVRYISNPTPQPFTPDIDSVMLEDFEARKSTILLSGEPFLVDENMEQFRSEYEYSIPIHENLSTELSVFGRAQAGDMSISTRYVVTELVVKILVDIFKAYKSTGRRLGYRPFREHIVRNTNKSSGTPYNRLGNARHMNLALDTENTDMDVIIKHRGHAFFTTVLNATCKIAIAKKPKTRPITGVSYFESICGRALYSSSRDAMKHSCLSNHLLIGMTPFFGYITRVLEHMQEQSPNGKRVFSHDFSLWDRNIDNSYQFMFMYAVIHAYGIVNGVHEDYLYKMGLVELNNMVYSYIYHNGKLSKKANGVCSGNSRTADGNSVMDLILMLASFVDNLLFYKGQDRLLVYLRDYMVRLTTMPYLSVVFDDKVLDVFYKHILQSFNPRCLSDDGFVLTDLSVIKSPDDYLRMFFLYSGFQFTPEKYTDRPVKDGIGEFCSAHTIKVWTGERYQYMLSPNPNRLIGALVEFYKESRYDVDVRISILSSYILLSIPLLFDQSIEPRYRRLPLLLLDIIKEYILKYDISYEAVAGCGVYVFGTEEFYDNFRQSHDMSFFYDINRYFDMYLIPHDIDYPVGGSLDNVTLHSFDSDITTKFSNCCLYCSISTDLHCAVCKYSFCNCINGHAIKHMRSSGHNSWYLGKRPISCTKCKNDNVNDLCFVVEGKKYICLCRSCGGTIVLIVEDRFVLSTNSDVRSGVDFSVDYHYTERFISASTPVQKVKSAFEAGVNENPAVYYSHLTLLYFISLTKLKKYTDHAITANDDGTYFISSKPHPFVLNRHNSYFLVSSITCLPVTIDILGIGIYTITGAPIGPGDLIRVYQSVAGIEKCLNSVKPHSELGTIMRLLRWDNSDSEILHAKPCSSLNSGQQVAFEHIMANNFSFIQGPPGTGKTKLAAIVVHALVSIGKRVLVCSTSHAAVDNICDAIYKLPDMNCRVRRNVPTEHADRVRCTTPAFVGGAIAVLCSTFQTSLPSSSLFDVIVVDECTRCEDLFLFGFIQQVKPTRIIFFGDPKQLSAIHIIDDIPLRYTNVCMYNAGQCVMLTEQYRMHAAICDVVSKSFYDSQLVTSVTYPEDSSVPPIVCYNTNSEPVSSGTGGRSRYNVGVADAIISTWDFMRFILSGTSVVIVDYNLMYQYLVQRFRESNVDLRILTIDESQGREFDNVFICISVVNSFTMNKNRLNVALSRAKRHCIIFVPSDDVVQYKPFDLIPLVDYNGSKVEVVSVQYAPNTVGHGMVNLNVVSKDVPILKDYTLGNHLDVFGVDFEGCRVIVEEYKSCCAGCEVGVYHTRGSATLTGWPVLYDSDFTPHKLATGRGKQEFYVLKAFAQTYDRLKRSSCTFHDVMLRFVKYIYKYTQYRPCFVVFSYHLERALLYPYCMFGVFKCNCGRDALWANEYGEYCNEHVFEPTKFINPIIVDCQKDKLGLLTAHDLVCDEIHDGEQHEPSFDAHLAYCIGFKSGAIKVDYKLPDYTEIKLHYNYLLCQSIRIISRSFKAMIRSRHGSVCDVGCGDRPVFSCGCDPRYNGQTFDQHACNSDAYYFGNSLYDIDQSLVASKRKFVYVVGYFSDLVDSSHVLVDGKYYFIHGKRLYYNSMPALDFGCNAKPEFYCVPFPYLSGVTCSEKTVIVDFNSDLFPYVKLPCLKVLTLGTIVTCRICQHHYDVNYPVFKAYLYIRRVCSGIRFCIYDFSASVQSRRVLSKPAEKFVVKLPGYETRVKRHAGTLTIIKLKAFISELMLLKIPIYNGSFCYIGASNGSGDCPAVDLIAQYFENVVAIDMRPFDTTSPNVKSFIGDFRLYTGVDIFSVIYSDMYNIDSIKTDTVDIDFKDLFDFCKVHLMYNGILCVKVTESYSAFNVLNDVARFFRGFFYVQPNTGNITSELLAIFYGFMHECPIPVDTLTMYYGAMRDLCDGKSITDNLPSPVFHPKLLSPKKMVYKPGDVMTLMHLIVPPEYFEEFKKCRFSFFS